jgi:hypothetical protein
MKFSLYPIYRLLTVHSKRPSEIQGVRKRRFWVKKRLVCPQFNPSNSYRPANLTSTQLYTWPSIKSLVSLSNHPSKKKLRKLELQEIKRQKEAKWRFFLADSLILEVINFTSLCIVLQSNLLSLVLRNSYRFTNIRPLRDKKIVSPKLALFSKKL